MNYQLISEVFMLLFKISLFMVCFYVIIQMNQKMNKAKKK